MVSVFLRQVFINFLCGFATVDNTEDLSFFRQFCSDFFMCLFSLQGKRHTAEATVLVLYIWAEFLGSSGSAISQKQVLQGRLCCGTKHGCGAIMRDELGNGGNTWLEMSSGHHLRFIKNNHAVGHVVKFSTG